MFNSRKRRKAVKVIGFIFQSFLTPFSFVGTWFEVRRDPQWRHEISRCKQEKMSLTSTACSTSHNFTTKLSDFSKLLWNWQPRLNIFYHFAITCNFSSQVTPILNFQWFKQLHCAQIQARTCFCNQAAQLQILWFDGYCAIQTMPHYTEVHSFDFTKETINMTKSIAGKHDFMPGFFSSFLIQRINKVISERGISLHQIMFGLFAWLAELIVSLSRKQLCVTMFRKRVFKSKEWE